MSLFKQGVPVYFSVDFADKIIKGLLKTSYFDYIEGTGEYKVWVVRVENARGVYHTIVNERNFLPNGSTEYEKEQKREALRKDIEGLQKALRELK